MSADLDLAAIEARAAAATEGPWEVDVAIEGDTRHLGIASPKGGVVPVATNVEWGTFETAIYEEADAEFIAASRTDVPALVARVRELEAENAKIDDLDEALRQRDREILGLRRERDALATIRTLAAGVKLRMVPSGGVETLRHRGAVEFAEEVLGLLGGGK